MTKALSMQTSIAPPGPAADAASFGRHLRTMIGLTAIEFRERYDGAGMFERFRQELVLPHLPALRALTPLGYPIAPALMRPRATRRRYAG